MSNTDRTRHVGNRVPPLRGQGEVTGFSTILDMQDSHSFPALIYKDSKDASGHTHPPVSNYLRSGQEVEEGKCGNSGLG